MTASFPLWPLAILAGLVALGWRQSRERLVQPGTLAKLALGMLVLSLYGVLTAFGAGWVPMLAWAAGFAVSARLARALFAPRGLAREGAAIRMPGSWVPMGLMVGIFTAKFVLGVATGVGAHVVQEAWFIAVMSLTFGLFSGAFSARAQAVQRFASAQPAM